MTRSELRAAMPLVTAFGDDMRKDFPELVIRYYRENGIEYGKRGPVGVRPVIDNLAGAKSKRQTKREGAS